MPKKKPLTSSNAESLNETLHNGYLGLLLAKSILAGYLKKNADLRIRLNQLCQDYHSFEQDCADELLRKKNT